MDIFLTGGTGYIGSYVANELLNKGHKLTILARNPNKVPYLARHRSVTMIQGDLNDREAVKHGLYNKDAVVHIALGSNAMAVRSVESDLLPAVFIFETAALMGVKKIITTSTISTFGNTGPVYGEYIVNRPTSFYGAVKAAAQSFLFAVSQTYGVQVNIISPGYTIGNPLSPGATIYNDPTLPGIVNKVLAEKNVVLTKGAGTQFIGVEDLAKVYSAVLESDHNRRVFISVGTEFITWEEVAKTAIDMTGSKSWIVLEGVGEEPVALDISPIKDEFGFAFASREKLYMHLNYLIKR